MFDCIICGAGPSGMCAAIACARNNKKVLLIENEGMLGGTNTLSLVGPLMSFHNENKQVIGGIANEIVERLISTKDCIGHVKDPFAFCSTITPFSVEGLKALYFKYIEEEKITLLLHTRVIDAKTEKGFVKSITTINTDGIKEYTAKVFIDATGNGDLCAYSGCNYTVGREEDELCQPMTMPFIVAGVNFDKVVEAIKKDPSNFDADPDYDYKYVGVSGFFKEVIKGKENHDFDVSRDRVLFFQGVRKDQAIINTTRVLKKSALKAEELTEAECIGRKQVQIVYNFLKKYIPGFEDCYIEATPVQIGIRESRHVECDYMITASDLREHRMFNDTIAVGAYPMDIHSPVGDKLEVDSVYQKNLAYEIPLRAIIPTKTSNLIVTGRCIGATHEANASLRVTPIVMALGEAAGTLASLAVKENGDVRKVNLEKLQHLLKDNKNILHY